MEAGVILAGKLLDLQIRQTELFIQAAIAMKALAIASAIGQVRRNGGQAMHHMVEAEEKHLRQFQEVADKLEEGTNSILKHLESLRTLAPTGGGDG